MLAAINIDVTPIVAALVASLPASLAAWYSFRTKKHVDTGNGHKLGEMAAEFFDAYREIKEVNSLPVSSPKPVKNEVDI